MPFAEGTARAWLRREKAAANAAPALCRAEPRSPDGPQKMRIWAKKGQFVVFPAAAPAGSAAAAGWSGEHAAPPSRQGGSDGARRCPCSLTLFSQKKRKKYSMKNNKIKKSKQTDGTSSLRRGGSPGAELALLGFGQRGEGHAGGVLGHTAWLKK